MDSLAVTLASVSATLASRLLLLRKAIQPHLQSVQKSAVPWTPTVRRPSAIVDVQYWTMAAPAPGTPLWTFGRKVVDILLPVLLPTPALDALASTLSAAVEDSVTVRLDTDSLQPVEDLSAEDLSAPRFPVPLMTSVGSTGRTLAVFWAAVVVILLVDS